MFSYGRDYHAAFYKHNPKVDCLMVNVFCVFQLLDEKKLKAVDNLYHEFETPEKANKM